MLLLLSSSLFALVSYCICFSAIRLLSHKCERKLLSVLLSVLKHFAPPRPLNIIYTVKFTKSAVHHCLNIIVRLAAFSVFGCTVTVCLLVCLRWGLTMSCCGPVIRPVSGQIDTATTQMRRTTLEPCVVSCCELTGFDDPSGPRSSSVINSPSLYTVTSLLLTYLLTY